MTRIQASNKITIYGHIYHFGRQCGPEILKQPSGKFRCPRILPHNKSCEGLVKFYAHAKYLSDPQPPAIYTKCGLRPPGKGSNLRPVLVWTLDIWNQLPKTCQIERTTIPLPGSDVEKCSAILSNLRAPPWPYWQRGWPQIYSTRVQSPAKLCQLGVSSFIPPHYLRGSLGPFSLRCAQKWP